MTVFLIHLEMMITLFIKHLNKFVLSDLLCNLSGSKPHFAKSNSGTLIDWGVAMNDFDDKQNHKVSVPHFSKAT